MIHNGNLAGEKEKREPGFKNELWDKEETK